MQSITSHVPQPHPNGVSTTSGGANNNTSRGGPSNGAQSRSGNATNGISTTTSKRSRTNANNRAASPVQDQYYGHNGNGIVDHSHSGMTNGTGATHNGTHQHANGVNGHRVAGIPNGNVTNGRTGRNGGDTFGNVPPSSASAQHPSLPQPYPIGTTQHNMVCPFCDQTLTSAQFDSLTLLSLSHSFPLYPVGRPGNACVSIGH